MRPSRKTRVALGVGGLSLNLLAAALLLSLSPRVLETHTNSNTTLFIVWHRSIGFYGCIAALFLGFLLQLIAALKE